MDEEVLEQLKQKTPVVRLVENPRHVEEVARLEHYTLRNDEVKKEDLDGWKAQILAEMTKKIRGYGRVNNSQDLAVMVTRGVNKSPFTE